MLRADAREPDGTVRGEPPAGDSREEPGRSASFHLAEIAGHLSRLARIRAARARLRMRRVVFLALGGSVLAIVATAAGLSGVHLLVRGLTAGLTEVADGRAWLAELASGLVILAGTALLLVSLQLWSERRLLRDLARRHGNTRNTH